MRTSWTVVRTPTFVLLTFFVLIDIYSSGLETERCKIDISKRFAHHQFQRQFYCIYHCKKSLKETLSCFDFWLMFPESNFWKTSTARIDNKILDPKAGPLLVHFYSCLNFITDLDLKMFVSSDSTLWRLKNGCDIYYEIRQNYLSSEPMCEVVERKSEFYVFAAPLIQSVFRFA